MVIILLTPKYEYDIQLSPPSDKDYIHSRAYGVLNIFPNSFCLDLSKLIIDRQIGGTCLYHGFGKQVSFNHYAETGDWRTFAFGFGDAIKGFDGEGSYARVVLENGKKYGLPFYEDFPYDGTHAELKAKLELNKDELFQKAFNHRISLYTTLADVNEIKAALIQTKRPVLIVIPLTSSFYNGKWNNAVIPDASSDVWIRHGVIIVGWKEDNTFIVVDSQGMAAGFDNGKWYMPFDYPIYERWSETDNINIIPFDSNDPNTHRYYYCIVGTYGKGKVDYAWNKHNSLLSTINLNTDMATFGDLIEVYSGSYKNPNDANRRQKKISDMGIKCEVKYY
jgi:hypothetical protein